MKLALAMIVKNDPKELKLLERCLKSLDGQYDKAFVTITDKEGDWSYPNTEVSYFPWIKDFSAARNFNFSQVPEEYDYIMWSDADDVWRNFDKRKLKPKDAYAFWYLYAFDEDKQPIVSHKKTMIVKNDGSFEWKGKIHEDLLANRDINIEFIEDMHRMHLTDEERIEESRHRNLDIAKETYKDDKDPRNLINLANSLMGVGKYEEAKQGYELFLKESQSSDEKYLARQTLADIESHLGNKQSAFEKLYICIGQEPTWPDAYLQLGKLFFDDSNLDAAEKYLLLGLAMKPAYRSMIVFNPRDYDYNPMNLLAKVYFRKGRPDMSLPLLKGCLQINPENVAMKNMVKEMEKEVASLKKIQDIIEEIKKLDSKEEIKKKIESLPIEYRSHPGICMIWNAHFFKEESSGKDITYYCGFTTHEWNPELFKTKGFGGSEEAVVNLSKNWAKDCYNVTVYANIGADEIVCDGVTWKPYWAFNPKDKTDKLIIWRSPRLCDYDLNATDIYIDLHDVIKDGEFTKDRLKKISKVFVKTKFHKSLFPSIPEEKFAIIPNGQDTSVFKEEIKDPMMILNTSSPDRSIDAVIEIYNQVKHQVPDAQMYWAYGWGIYDDAHAGDQKMMTWKENIVKRLDEAGIIQLGKVPQKDIASWYQKANVFLYPTEFAEIDCISVKKAQLAGCQVITTDFGALAESVQHGVKVHSNKTKDNWCAPGQISFAVEDPLMIKEFVEETVKALKAPKVNKEAIEFGKSFEWSIISKKWINIWK
jgi:glycosyltransferase involved in cell wall biosynthesis